MEIAFFAYGIYPHESNGAAFSARLIVDGLRDRGHNVDIYSCSEKISDIVEVTDDEFRIPTKQGNRATTNLSVYRNFPDMNNYDVIHVYGPKTLPAIVLKSSVPIVATMNGLAWTCIDLEQYLKNDCPNYTIRDRVRDSFEVVPSYVGPLKLGMEMIGNRLVKRARAFTVQTEGMKSILRNCGFNPMKISVVPNILDESFVIDQNPPREQKLIFLGRLIERKGVLDIIEGFKRAEESVDDDWKLDLYGRGELESEIRTRIDGDERISLSYADYQDLPKIYAESSGLIHGSKYPEPFSRTWLEAMATGTPIVCSRNPSSESVLSNYAYLYNPFDMHEIVESLTEIMVDDSNRKKICKKMKKRVEIYRHERVAIKYEQVYLNNI